MGAADKYATSDRTLKALKRANICARPENYELWYTHLSHGNERLSSDLENHFRKHGTFTEEACLALYQKYFAPTYIQREITSSLQSMSERTRQQLAQSLKRAEAAALEKEDTLEIVSTLQDLLADINIASGELQYQTAFLEERLTEASRKVASLRRRNDLSTHMIAADPLTGIGTRGHFDRELVEHMLATQRHQDELCLMLVELDGFSDSDTPEDLTKIEGAISSVAALLNSNIKGQDVLCRFDDFIFAIILPKTKLEFARILAGRILAALKDATFASPAAEHPPESHVTVSIGIAEFRFPEESSLFVDRAVLCLTRASASGGNQIICQDVRQMHEQTEITLMQEPH